MTQPANIRLVTEAIADARYARKGDVPVGGSVETWAAEVSNDVLAATSTLSGKRAVLDSNTGISNVRSIGRYVSWEQGGSSWYAPGDGSLKRLPTGTNFGKIAGWGSSTMQGFRTALRAAFETRAGLSYFNGGVGGQGAANILARLGTRPALIKATTIPASGPVTVTSSNMPSHAPNISFTGTLAGVPGTLAKATAATQGQFTFTRTTAGDAVTVPEGAPFIPDEGPANRAAVTILNIGKNDMGANGYSGYLTTDVLIAETKKAYDYVSGLGKHVLLMGHYCNPGFAVDSTQRRDVDIMNAFYATYGDRYVDLGGYVSGSDIWTHTGITPTTEDLAEQAIGNLPPSLSSDGTHMIEAAYTAFVENVIVPRMNQLGWLTVTEAPATPTAPSDYLLRYTMDYLTSTVSNGAEVSALANQGGTLNVELTNKPSAGTYPTLKHNAVNGHASLVFPNTDAWIGATTDPASAPVVVAEGAPRTHVAVVKVRDVTVNVNNFPKIMSSSAVGTPSSYQQLGVNLSGTPRLASTANGSSVSSATGGGNLIGKWAVIVATCAADGSVTITSSDAAEQTTAGHPVGQILGMRFGAQHGGAPSVASQLDGEIAEYAIYGRVLSSAERSATISAMKAKYGIA